MENNLTIWSRWSDLPKRQNELFKKLFQLKFWDVLMWPSSAHFSFISSFSNNFTDKNCKLSGIRALIVGVIGKHADHFTTTMVLGCYKWLILDSLQGLTAIIIEILTQAPFQTTLQIKTVDSAGFELGSLELKASTLIIWPPPQPMVLGCYKWLIVAKRQTASKGSQQ